MLKPMMMLAALFGLTLKGALLAQLVAPALTSGDPLKDLLTYGAVIGTTLALGAAKKYTTIADTAIGRITKPVQPLIALAAGVLLPALIHGTPNVPDPQALAVAPTATLLVVAAAEVWRRFVPQQPSIGSPSQPAMFR